MEAKDLKGKTIFDFCKDKKILAEIAGEYSEQYYKSFPQVCIARDLVNYAVRIGDKEFLSAALELQKGARKILEGHVDSAMKKGIIVD